MNNRKIYFHRHPEMELKYDIPSGHVIVDESTFNEVEKIVVSYNALKAENEKLREGFSMLIETIGEIPTADGNLYIIQKFSRQLKEMGE